MHVVPMTFFATLAICVIYIAYTRYKEWKKSPEACGGDSSCWPPVINPCPDYWVQSANGSKCKNIHGSGDVPKDHLVDAMSKTSTRRELREKCLWAIQNSIPWEGVENTC